MLSKELKLMKLTNRVDKLRNKGGLNENLIKKANRQIKKLS